MFLINSSLAGASSLQVSKIRAMVIEGRLIRVIYGFTAATAEEWVPPSQQMGQHLNKEAGDLPLQTCRVKPQLGARPLYGGFDCCMCDGERSAVCKLPANCIPPAAQSHSCHQGERAVSCPVSCSRTVLRGSR